MVYSTLRGLPHQHERSITNLHQRRELLEEDIPEDIKKHIKMFSPRVIQHVSGAASMECF